jgi:hypothetical protein
MISGLPSIWAYLGFLIRHLRHFAILCADNIVYTLTRGGTPDPGKCLLVRLDGIGDYILWSDAAKATKAHLARKDVAVVLLANELWADLAEPEFDEIWRIDCERFERNLVYRYRWLLQIRKAGFGTAIQPTYSRRLLLGDAAIRYSDAVERIGYQTDPESVEIGLRKIVTGGTRGSSPRRKTTRWSSYATRSS